MDRHKKQSPLPPFLRIAGVLLLVAGMVGQYLYQSTVVAMGAYIGCLVCFSVILSMRLFKKE